MAIVTSKLWTANLRDALHGLILAACTTPFTMIYDSLVAGNVHMDWKHIGIVAITGGLGYVMKKVFTPSQTITTNVSNTTTK